MLTFLNQVKTELYNVTWPTRKQIIRLTVIVVAISLIVGLYLGVVDYFFTTLLELIIA